MLNRKGGKEKIKKGDATLFLYLWINDLQKSRGVDTFLGQICLREENI